MEETVFMDKDSHVMMSIFGPCYVINKGEFECGSPCQRSLESDGLKVDEYINEWILEECARQH